MCPEVDGVAGVGHTSHTRNDPEKPVMLALSAVAGTLAANYQTCHENAEQLRTLQTWISEMASATK